MQALAVLPNGHVVTVGSDHRVLVWDPDQPEADPYVAAVTLPHGVRTVLDHGRPMSDVLETVICQEGDPAGPGNLRRIARHRSIGGSRLGVSSQATRWRRPRYSMA